MPTSLRIIEILIRSYNLEEQDMSAAVVAKPFTGRVQGLTSAVSTRRVSRAARVPVRAAAEKDQVGNYRYLELHRVGLNGNVVEKMNMPSLSSTVQRVRPGWI